MAFSPLTTPVNYVTINGQKTPTSFAYVQGASDIRRWDELQGPGLSGAFARFLGKKLSHFSVHIQLLTDEDWINWYLYKVMVEAIPKVGAGKAFSVWHPWLVDCKIKAAVVEEIMQPTEVEPGKWDVEIRMLEFRRPKPQYVKPEASDEKPSDDPWDKVIEAKTKQLENQEKELAKP